MSLNGLDNPVVLEAYQCVLTEAGGWFLLRYVSRDEVALLDRGTGGVPEVRNAIEGYEEISPLYGFLQYRRRKIVLSYLPPGLSRLIQARTTVQFQSILDKFAPHDTVFSLTQSSELTESALSSACLLHTASGSITSSSSSLRRRRLMEIAEDAEEAPGAKEAPGTKDVTQTPSAGPDLRQRSFSQLSEATIVPPPTDTQSPLSNGNDTAESPKSTENHQPNGRAPSIAEGRASEYSASPKPIPDDVSYAASEPRRSTQSARPSLRDVDRSSTYKQKVKLGPRPSVDGTGRPRTSGNISRTVEQRPVVSLPAGMRSSSLRKSNPTPARPRSQGSTMASMSGLSRSSTAAPPVPPLLVPPLSTPISRPQLSPGARSLSALSSAGTSHEKERLMKALQLRKSQMEKRAQGGKKNQNVSRETETPPLDVSENKENLGQEHEHTKSDNGDDKRTSSAETGKLPLSETQPSVPPEPVDPVDPPKDEEITESLAAPTPIEAPTTGSDLGGDPVSDSSPPDTTQISTDVLESSTPGPSPPAPIITQPETRAVQGDLAASVDRETKSGPDSPSAIRDVPLGDLSPRAPAEEIAAASPPPETPLVRVEPGGADQALECADPLPPQSLPLPTAPTLETPPTSVPDPSNALESHQTTPQHEVTPEFPTVEEKDPSQRKEKRKPLLEPIQVPTPEYSDDDNLLSDDSFMEELTSATVEEAKPISVGKSPLSPGYSNGANDTAAQDAWRNSRAVSNPSAASQHMPNMHALAIGRSVSTPHSDAANPVSPVLVAKKINVSSGISKRIKALEKFSGNRDSMPPSSQNLTAPSASSSFEALRKRASVSLGPSPDNTPPSRNGAYTPEAFSRASSVRRRDSQSSSSAKRTTRSVSVTARIIRDPPPSDDNPESPEPGVLNLQASPLTVEHETLEAPALETPLSQSLSVESATNKSDKRSMSVSSAGSGPPPRSESRLSISSSKQEAIPPSKPTSDIASSPEEKKESRTSRLFRRMSTMTSHSRKNTVGTLSPSVKEEIAAPLNNDSETTAEAPQAVDIGEVNVQFPDTLLWKRRFVRVDDKGYLVLTPANADSTGRNMVKRYHMTEFRTPCLPDEDRQELPNSIMLDFLNGSTLQCACESRQGQGFVLQTLIQAHGIHKQEPTH